MLKSESKYEYMVDIMMNLHQYVSTKTSVSKSTIPGSDKEVDVVEDRFHTILFGGYQMTAARACGSQRIQKNSESDRDRLEGLKPVCEDYKVLGIPLRVWKLLSVIKHQSNAEYSLI